MNQAGTKVLSTIAFPTPTMKEFAARLFPRLVLAALPVVLTVPASFVHAQDMDRAELQEQDRMRRADVRASVTSFSHIDAAALNARSTMSDEERLEMRRQIDEAIRKAYGRRQQARD
jgi:hypothetical protein